MDALVVNVEGIGWWSPGAADWSAAGPLLRDGKPLPLTGGGKPAAAVLPATERRRAPESVLIACEVAAQACAMANRNPASLPCVFASMHGDIAITNILCSTLADDPLSLSPTKFHNSVHNAPVGYWTVATGSHAASSAVSAWHGSIAAGLFEAAVLAHADATPVLFAAYDITAVGALADALYSPSPFGMALVVAPARGERCMARLRLRHDVAAPAQPQDPSPTAPIAAAVALLTALARGDTATLRFSDGAGTALTVEVDA
jgi:hypothetical protein